MSVEGVTVKVLNLEKFSFFLSCTQGFLFLFSCDKLSLSDRILM